MKYQVMVEVTVQVVIEIEARTVDQAEQSAIDYAKSELEIPDSHGFESGVIKSEVVWSKEVEKQTYEHKAGTLGKDGNLHTNGPHSCLGCRGNVDPEAWQQ